MNAKELIDKVIDGDVAEDVVDEVTTTSKVAKYPRPMGVVKKKRKDESAVNLSIDPQPNPWDKRARNKYGLRVSTNPPYPPRSRNVDPTVHEVLDDFIEGHFTTNYLRHLMLGTRIKKDPRDVSPEWPYKRTEDFSDSYGKWYAKETVRLGKEIAQQSGEPSYDIGEGDLLEATAWVPTRYSNVETAVKQMMKGLRNFKVVKQSRTYARAESGFGPAREWLLKKDPNQNVQILWKGSRDPGGSTVYYRTLKAGEKPYQP